MLSGLVANSVVRDWPIKSSLIGSREDYGCDMKEVAATTTLRLERYPFCAALHWIVVAAGVFCSLNREILATATHPVRKCRIFLPKNSDRGRMRHVTRAPALESDAKTPVSRLRSSGQAMTSSCRQHFLYITLYSSRSANSTVRFRCAALRFDAYFQEQFCNDSSRPPWQPQGRSRLSQYTRVTRWT